MINKKMKTRIMTAKRSAPLKIISTKPKTSSLTNTNLKMIKTPLKTKNSSMTHQIKIETQPPTKNFYQKISNIFYNLLPLIGLILITWWLFYRVVPQIGVALNNRSSQAFEYLKTKAHDLKDYFYRRCRDWNFSEWLAQASSILIPTIIGFGIAASCFLLPGIGMPLGGVVLLGTIVFSSLMFFTNNTVADPKNPPEPEVIVIDHSAKVMPEEVSFDQPKKLVK